MKRAENLRLPFRTTWEAVGKVFGWDGARRVVVDLDDWTYSLIWEVQSLDFQIKGLVKGSVWGQ